MQAFDATCSYKKFQHQRGLRPAAFPDVKGIKSSNKCSKPSILMPALCLAVAAAVFQGPTKNVHHASEDNLILPQMKWSHMLTGRVYNVQAKLKINHGLIAKLCTPYDNHPKLSSCRSVCAVRCWYTSKFKIHVLGCLTCLVDQGGSTETAQ